MQSYISISIIILSSVIALAIYNLKTRGNKWLSLLLAIYATHSLLRWGITTDNYFISVYLPILVFPSFFIIGSVIFLYTGKVLFNEKKQKILLHLIFPATALIVHISLFFIIPDEMTVIRIKSQVGFHKTYTIIISTSIVLYNIVISSITMLKIVTYRKKFRETFSNDMFKSTKWLFYIVIFNLIYLGIKGFVIIFFISRNLGLPFTIVEDFVLLFFLIYLIYYLITRPEMLPLENIIESKTEKKYSKVNLPENTRKLYAVKLEEYMASEQAFLNENISVPQISKELNIPQHHLSMTINTEFGINFYNYVNRQRVEFAKKILSDPKQKDEPILMIAFLSGFQSKTSFNKAFKTFSGKTPTEFRKSSFF